MPFITAAEFSSLAFRHGSFAGAGAAILGGVIVRFVRRLLLVREAAKLQRQMIEHFEEKKRQIAAALDTASPPSDIRASASSVTVKWIDDPGKKVSGQWHVACRFWEFFPTEKELPELIRVAQRAIAARQLSEAWFLGDTGACLRCQVVAVDPGQKSICPACGYSGRVLPE